MKQYKNRREFEKATGIKRAGRHVGNPNERFRDPAHHVILRNKNHLCCHGFIVNALGFKEPHAWVEFGGLVFDLYYGTNMLQGEFYKVFKVEGVIRYTATQLRKILDEKRTYGPFRR